MWRVNAEQSFIRIGQFLIVGFWDLPGNWWYWDPRIYQQNEIYFDSTHQRSIFHGSCEVHIMQRRTFVISAWYVWTVFRFTSCVLILFVYHECCSAVFWGWVDRTFPLLVAVCNKCDYCIYNENLITLSRKNGRGSNTWLKHSKGTSWFSYSCVVLRLNLSVFRIKWMKMSIIFKYEFCLLVY